MGQPKSDFEQVIRDAEAAFWAEIARRCPEATAGDLPPEVAIPFDDACEEAACQWYAINVPDDASKAVQIRVRVHMRAPKKGERGWMVKSDDVEEALEEVLKESEELGWFADHDHTDERDEDGMRAVTITFEKEF